MIINSDPDESPTQKKALIYYRQSHSYIMLHVVDSSLGLQHVLFDPTVYLTNVGERRQIQQGLYFTTDLRCMKRGLSGGKGATQTLTQTPLLTRILPTDRGIPALYRVRGGAITFPPKGVIFLLITIVIVRNKIIVIF